MVNVCSPRYSRDPRGMNRIHRIFHPKLQTGRSVTHQKEHGPQFFIWIFRESETMLPNRHVPRSITCAHQTEGHPIWHKYHRHTSRWKLAGTYISSLGEELSCDATTMTNAILTFPPKQGAALLCVESNKSGGFAALLCCCGLRLCNFAGSCRNHWRVTSTSR